MILTCASCGHTFAAKRSHAKTCSATCRKRLSRPPAEADALAGYEQEGDFIVVSTPAPDWSLPLWYTPEAPIDDSEARRHAWAAAAAHRLRESRHAG